MFPCCPAESRIRAAESWRTGVRWCGWCCSPGWTDCYARPATSLLHTGARHTGGSKTFPFFSAFHQPNLLKNAKTKLYDYISGQHTRVFIPFPNNYTLIKTSTGLYRSCAAPASFSGTFDLILFQALNIEFIVEKVWFGVVSIDGLNKQTK